MDRIIALLQSPEAWIALGSLALLEIILGIDNIVFIAVLTDRLPKSQRSFAYRLGLGAAMLSRIALLFAINWVRSLTNELAVIAGQSISARDLVLLGGGLFLIGKSTHEIFTKVQGLEEGHDGDDDEQERSGSPARKANASLWNVIGQIMILDMIFSLDSVITAVGVVDEIEVMVAAIVLAVAVMLLFAERVGTFVNRHPSMKILALSFLLLIGVLLTAEAFEQHINKGTIYFAMAFALIVELLNMRFRKKSGIEV